jgi:hypothetical protein
VPWPKTSIGLHATKTKITKRASREGDFIETPWRRIEQFGLVTQKRNCSQANKKEKERLLENNTNQRIKYK